MEKRSREGDREGREGHKLFCAHEHARGLMPLLCPRPPLHLPQREPRVRAAAVPRQDVHLPLRGRHDGDDLVTFCRSELSLAIA